MILLFFAIIIVLFVVDFFIETYGFADRNTIRMADKSRKDINKSSSRPLTYAQIGKWTK